MSPFVVSLMFTAGCSAWIYAKFQRYSGNETKQSASATAVCAVVIFIASFFITNAILK